MGIAVGSGRTAAEAGDIVLMGEPLSRCRCAAAVARDRRIIRQNIVVFAFAVNLVGVVVTGWLWPFLGSSDEWNKKRRSRG